MSPRSILKHSSAHQQALAAHHAVHFPPSPSLTRTFTAHSPLQYDRSPIEVSPNNCALPERGCPGRTYTIQDDEDGSSYFSPKLFAPMSTSRGHVHPRALQRQQQQLLQNEVVYGPLPPMSCPPLIPDFSSSESSEESDGVCSPLPLNLARQPYSSPPDRHSYTPTAYDPFIGSIQASSSMSINYAASKHPSYPSYPSYSPQFPSPPMIDPVQPPRRRRPSPRQSSRRRPSPQAFDEYDDPGYDDDADVATPTSPSHLAKQRRGRKSADYAAMCKSSPNFNYGDDAGSGCLGGF